MRPDATSLSKAIISTLSYSDHFHFPLTFTELHSRLIQRAISAVKLKLALSALIRSQTIGHQQIYYFLKGKSSYVKQRKLYASLSRPLRSYINSLIPTLAKVPGIVAIYLTGSLALNNTDGHDDIDLMVITKQGRLWTTRLLLTAYTTLLGLRRTPQSTNIMGKLCLNLYLTTNSLMIPAGKRSLYTAYELVQAVPLHDPLGTHRLLLASNSWIREYLPNFPIPNSKITQGGESPGFFEHALFYLQYLYMRRKITREYITLDAAFFHPHNPAPKLKL